MKRNRVIAVLTAGVVSILISSAVLAQVRGITSRKPRQPNIKRVIRPEGWQIEGLEVSQPIIPRQPSTNQPQGGAPVYVTTLKPEEEVVFESLLYVMADDDESLYLGTRQFWVRNIIRYDVAGRAYCYLMRVHHLLANDPKRGNRMYGPETNLFYYDEDGDGKFEQLSWGMEMPDSIPPTPAWAASRTAVN